MSEFVPFPKIPRLRRDCVITEKIDGTNASVYITEDGYIATFSRNRQIFPGKNTDNAGFADFVQGNLPTFRELGPGRHYGEWWGPGIQRGYGLKEKRFSLFNTGRWSFSNLPEGLYVVPVIYHGPFSTFVVDDEVAALARFGSYAAPGYPDPEGVVIFLHAAGQLFKQTIKDDEKPKGQAA